MIVSSRGKLLKYRKSTLNYTPFQKYMNSYFGKIKTDKTPTKGAEWFGGFAVPSDKIYFLNIKKR